MQNWKVWCTVSEIKRLRVKYLRARGSSVKVCKIGRLRCKVSEIKRLRVKYLRARGSRVKYLTIKNSRLKGSV